MLCTFVACFLNQSSLFTCNVRCTQAHSVYVHCVQDNVWNLVTRTLLLSSVLLLPLTDGHSRTSQRHRHRRRRRHLVEQEYQTHGDQLGKVGEFENDEGQLGKCIIVCGMLLSVVRCTQNKHYLK